MRAGATSGAVLARARYIEDTLFAAVSRGIDQYVMVGAGLDTFAFRRPDLGDRLRVFEIDHPATQAFKRERMTSAGLVPPANLHFASANLERESVASALARVPYDHEMPAFFAWPGGTMYLTREAIFGTLRSIVSVAAPGSELVFDYVTADLFKPEASERVKLTQQIVRSLGEPWISGFEPSTLGSELSTVGIRLIENLSPDEIQTRYFKYRTDGFRRPELIHFARTVID